MLLILFIENTFKLYLCNTIYINDNITLNSKLYKVDLVSKNNEGFIGFFDWLRIEDEKIVGLRLSFFDDLSYTNIFIGKSYVKGVFDDRSIELLFKDIDYDYDLSGDQDFTNNYVYRSEDGEYLLTFGLDHLTEKELGSLFEYCDIISKKELESPHPA